MLLSAEVWGPSRVGGKMFLPLCTLCDVMVRWREGREGGGGGAQAQHWAKNSRPLSILSVKVQIATQSFSECLLSNLTLLPGVISPLGSLSWTHSANVIFTKIGTVLWPTFTTVAAGCPFRRLYSVAAAATRLWRREGRYYIFLMMLYLNIFFLCCQYQNVSFFQQ